MVDVNRITELYDQGRSIGSVAAELELPWREVRRAIVQSGRELRGRAVEFDKDLAVRLYTVDQKSLCEVAERCGVAASSIRNQLVASSVELRSASEGQRLIRGSLVIDERIRELTLNGVGVNAIAAELDVPRTRVRRVAAETVPAFDNSAELSLNERICALYDQGLSMMKISRATEIPEMRVKKIIVESGRKPRPAGGKSRIQLDKVRVEVLYNSGMSLRQVADQCGCSESFMQAYMKRNGIPRRSTSGAMTLARAPREVEAAE